MFKTELLNYIEWLEWHYDHFRNPFEYEFDNKHNKYKVSIFEFCCFVDYNIDIYSSCWCILKFIELYGDKNSDIYLRLQKVLEKSFAEFRLLYVHKNANKLKQVNKSIFEYCEWNNIKTIKNHLCLKQYIDLNLEQEQHIINLFAKELPNIIYSIVED